MNRIFLGWERPALLSAADHLIAEYRRGAVISLESAIVVLPAARASRRLLEILLERVEHSGESLRPPAIVTMGNLPELLYEPRRPLASPLLEALGWFHALRESDPRILTSLLPEPPPRDDSLGWLAVAEMLAALHRDIAAGGLRMAEVLERAGPLEAIPDPERWRALSALEAAYLASLASQGYDDRDEARRLAVEEGRCRAPSDIVLVALADPSTALRRMLEAVRDRVTSLVFAPAEEEASFDELGALRLEAWRERKLDLDPRSVELLDRPADQAAAAARAIAELDSRYSAEEITIGAADPEVIPHLERILGRCGLPVRDAAGVPLARSAPLRLLEAASRYREERSFRSIADLARHPDLEAWLRARAHRDPAAETARADPANEGSAAGSARSEPASAEPSLAAPAEADWLTSLDGYATLHLPGRLDAPWPDAAPDGKTARWLHDHVEEWLEPLAGPARAVREWIPPVLELLARVYGDLELDRGRLDERLEIETFDVLRRALAEIHEAETAWWPMIDGAEAMRWMLSHLRGQPVPHPGGPPAIELLGWLELLLDDAPALVITGFNEGFVPEAVSAHPFLPDRLRRRLGLTDNEKRLARDAYALSAMIRSRETLRILLGRRSTASDPLAPSRLLFACEESEILERVAKLFPDEETGDAGEVSAPGILRAGASLDGFRIPLPAAQERPLRSMRVTAFRDYLLCPYRFYLRHVLGLEKLADRDEELDGRGFGSLAHDVLQSFGESALADSTRAEEIAEFLDRRLDERVRSLFGGEPRPAVRIQAEHLRERLHAFARWQAAWRAGGWRIVRAEASAGEAGGAALDVDGEPMRLRGRIDRIDRNDSTGELAILDYKTSDRAESPEKLHRKRSKGWVDLQLPLYRHLARSLDLGEPEEPANPAKLGYIALPRDAAKTGLIEAGWNAADLESADEAAREVIRKVRRQEFWPPAVRPPPFSEDFARICQDGQFGARREAASEAAAEREGEGEEES